MYFIVLISDIINFVKVNIIIGHKLDVILVVFWLFYIFII